MKSQLGGHSHRPPQQFGGALIVAAGLGEVAQLHTGRGFKCDRPGVSAPRGDQLPMALCGGVVADKQCQVGADERVHDSAEGVALAGEEAACLLVPIDRTPGIPAA
jgi:hypothetical protein